MSPFRVHRHAVDHGVEILTLQMIAAVASASVARWGGAGPATIAGDVGPPLLQLRQALSRGRRSAVVSDVVDFATEAIERKHRLALLRRQNAHGGIEGAVRQAPPANSCRRFRSPAPRAHHRRAEKSRRAEPADQRKASLAEMHALAQWSRPSIGARDVARAHGSRRSRAKPHIRICRMSGPPRATSSLFGRQVRQAPRAEAAAPSARPASPPRRHARQACQAAGKRDRGAS